MDQRIPEIMRLRKEGMSYGQIGKRLSLSRQRIYQIVKRWREQSIPISLFEALSILNLSDCNLVDSGDFRTLDQWKKILKPKYCSECKQIILSDGRSKTCSNFCSRKRNARFRRLAYWKELET